jgi:hypothetical protein
MNIKKQQVVDMINQLKSGTIYSVKFIKKDGTERLINSIKGTSKGVNGEGLKYNPTEKQLLPVYDLQLRRQGVEENKSWRMVNLQTIRELVVDKVRYVVMD